MVCRIIWVDRVALRGTEAAVGCGELAIVLQKRHIGKTQIDNLAKLNLLKGSHFIKSIKGEQQSRGRC